MKSELSHSVLPKQQMSKVYDKAQKRQNQESEKVPVRIDNRTIIFVLPSELEGAKERYLSSHQYQTSFKTNPNLLRKSG
jgi:hypothetical protein